MTAPRPAPGWYPDPAGSGQQRYFDGTHWGPLAPALPPGRHISIHYGPAYPPVDSEYSARSRVVAGLLQFFFGWWGLGRFYLGDYSTGAVQLTLGIVGIVTMLLCWIGVIILVPLSIWTLIEAVMMLAGAITDADGRKLR